MGLYFEQEIELDDISTRFADADVIVASDGLNSKIRNTYLEEFGCTIETRPNKFVWLGTHQTFRDAFTFFLSAPNMVVGLMLQFDDNNDVVETTSGFAMHSASMKCHMTKVPKPAAESSRTTLMATR